MSATAPEVPQTDDEWREEKFSTEQLASARRLGRVSHADLVKHMERFGPDGILDSAILLPRAQYEDLEKRVKAQEPIKYRRKRR